MFSVDEALDEPSHLALLDNSISVDVELGEEHIELLHAWWAHPLRGKDLIKEVGTLDLVKDPGAISIILVPDPVDLLFDVMLLILLLGYDW